MARQNPVLRAAVPAALRHLADFSDSAHTLGAAAAAIVGAARRHHPLRRLYVALGERLDGPVITCDGKLAAASGTRCAFDLII